MKIQINKTLIHITDENSNEVLIDLKSLTPEQKLEIIENLK